MTTTASSDELALILNCINEALEIVNPDRFRARTGFDRDRALVLHSELRRSLDEHDGAPGTVSAEISLQLAHDDAQLILACISQALILVDDWEFDTRTGFTPADAQQLQQELEQVARDLRDRG